MIQTAPPANSQINNQVTNPSPSARFRESGNNIGRHRDMVVSHEFQRAADFGMLEYAAQLTLATKDANEAMAAGLKLRGAYEFLQIMRNLGESPRMAPPRVITDNLDHKA